MFYAETILYVLILTVPLLYGKSITVYNCHNIDGYYWRDYTGDIPKDAVLGGTDNRGMTTYIGQTLHPGTCILPGKISELDKKMFYEYGGLEHSAFEDVKILCSQHPEKLHWVAVKNKEPITNIPREKKLIVGGHDKGRLLLIGRLPLPTGKLAIGKVLVESEQFELIYVGNEGQGFFNGGPYEILVYDTTGSKSEDADGCDTKTININIY
ncbi:hypothetical protein ILUMI_24363 [Ignelater luminosus]|uniref:Uncharacterized protein n=1 Tax=Ignelater luminosus TaxID=2038154 RepID=A0A8K0CAN4_IGNLU|nr:hypothetical protein ILUMI_24363 [Ignelater luminosus]